MATWATKNVIDNGFGSSRGGEKLHGAMLHHIAGTDGLAYVANWNDRDSHPTYHVARSGKVTGIVHPNKRPHSSAHVVDTAAIAFEVDNTATGGDWPVSDAAVEAIIVTCLHHMKEEGITKAEVNVPDAAQLDVFFVGWHSQYHATACPGPTLLSKIPYIVGELNRRIGGAKPAPIPTPQAGKASVITIGEWWNYKTAADAKALRDAVRVMPAGQYRIDKTVDGVPHLTKTDGQASGWVHPSVLGGSVPAPVKPKLKSNTEVARDIIAGRGGWGVDPERARKLTAAGYNAGAVQAEVNRLLS